MASHRSDTTDQHDRPEVPPRDQGAGGLPDLLLDGGVIPPPEDGEAKNTTVDRALQVLEAFMVDQRELSLADVSKVLNLDKSVIHRILATLVRRRFLDQDPVTKRYRVGLRIWEIGQRYMASSALEELAQKAIAEVVHGHPYATGYVATLDADQIVVLSAVRGPGPVNIYIDPGTRMPAALTATGRVMLAHLPPDRLERLWPRLQEQRRDLRGGRQTASLEEELERIRQRGYALNRGEYFPGIGTVAFCIRSQHGGPLAALLVDFPIAVETERLFEELPSELGAAVAELERVAATIPQS